MAGPSFPVGGSEGEKRKPMRRFLTYSLATLLPLTICAAAAPAQQAPVPPPSKFKMTSVFGDGDWIPVQYTCGVADGASPAVQWSDPPQGTASFALIFHDTDGAPAKGAGDVTHWILWNIPANAAQLPAGVQPDTSPDGMRQGKNVRGANGYRPPCPPVGARPHHYVFELYALDTKLDLPSGSSRDDLLKSMDGHVLGKATIVGIFGQGIDEKSWRWGTAKLP
jgi:Raf kinase inhibitor-like YbhB/YbcL family protein